MSAIQFDTHEFYTELVQSGLAEKTADALTKAVAKIEKAKSDELATKRDLAETKADLIKTIAPALTTTDRIGVARLKHSLKIMDDF